MKKDLRNAKLSLNRETLKWLTEDTLKDKQVAGGGGSENRSCAYSNYWCETAPPMC